VKDVRRDLGKIETRFSELTDMVYGPSALSIKSLVNRNLCETTSHQGQLKTLNDNLCLVNENVNQLRSELLAARLIKSTENKLPDPEPLEEVPAFDPTYFAAEKPPSMDMPFPLKTADQVKDFNMRLKDKGNSYGMCKYLANQYCARGTEVKSCADSVYKGLFDKELNWEMSWDGTKDYHMTGWSEEEKKEKKRESFQIFDRKQRIIHLVENAIKMGVGEKHWDALDSPITVSARFSFFLRKSKTGRHATADRKNRSIKAKEKDGDVNAKKSSVKRGKGSETNGKISCTNAKISGKKRTAVSSDESQNRNDELFGNPPESQNNNNSPSQSRNDVDFLYDYYRAQGNSKITAAKEKNVSVLCMETLI
jgi:hypothetical protein